MIYNIAKTILILSIMLLLVDNNNAHASSISKIGATTEVNEKVQYAWDISKGSLPFVATIEDENSQWSIDRKSNTGYYRNGVKWHDYGICQISKYYHGKIVNDKRFFTDWKWQVDQCWNLYKNWTKFYGSKNVYKTKKRFIIKN